MSLNKIIRIPEHPPRADQSAVVRDKSAPTGVRIHWSIGIIGTYWRPDDCVHLHYEFRGTSKDSVEPPYPVKREGVVEKTSIHWQTVAYANTDRADGRVEAILPEFGVFGKRPKRPGQHHHS